MRSVLSLQGEIEFYREEPSIAGTEMRDKCIEMLISTEVLEEQAIRREWEKFVDCKKKVEDIGNNNNKKAKEICEVLMELLAIQSGRLPEIYRRFEEIYQALSKEGIKEIEEMEKRGIDIIDLL